MYSREEANIRAINSSRFKKFKEFKSDYKFSVEINTLDDFLFYNEEKLVVKHKKCKHSEEMNLNYFMKKGSSFQKYKDFLKNENDYKCSKCMQEAKNKYFQNELKTKHDSKFKLLSDYTKKEDPVTIKHERCGEVFEINPSNYYSSKIICKKCKKTDNLNDKFDKKLKELKLHKEYKRIEDITDNKEVIKILHIPCNSILESAPNKFFTKKNKCSHCSFKEVVGEEISNEYALLSEYVNLRSYVELKHNKCGHSFEARVDNFLIAKRRCPNCEKDDKTNLSLSLSERKKAYEKDMNFEYEILTPAFTCKTTVDVRHKKCGTIFKRRANSLNLKNRGNICPECLRKEKEEQFLKDLKEKHGDSFELIGGFKKLQALAEFKHKGCKESFKELPSKLLKIDTAYCRHCSDYSYTTESLKKKIYTLTNGEYIMLGEYVDCKTKVKIRHLKCGRVFYVYTHIFFSSIRNNTDSLACKHCLADRKKLGVDGLQKKLIQKFGKLFTVHGIYKNLNTEIPIQCNHCGTVKNIKPRYLLNKKGCSSCKKTYL